MNRMLGLIVLFFSSFALAIPTTLQVSGRILRPDNTPFTGSNVQFELSLTNTAGTCVLYEEMAIADMSATNGRFSIRFGSNTASYNGNSGLANAVRNSGTLNCEGGGTYTPTASDTRQIVVSFFDGSIWNTISPNIVLNSVPFSMQAWRANSADSIGATSEADILTRALAPTCVAANSFLQWNGTDFDCVAASLGGAGTVTNVTSTNSYLTVATGTSTPALTVNVGTTTGTLAAGDDPRFTNSRPPTGTAGGDLAGTYPNPTLSNTGVIAGDYPKVTVNVQGRVTAGANLVAADIPNLDASKITSGNITNNVVNTSTSSGTASFQNLRIYDGASQYLVQVYPSGGTGYTITWPSNQGAANTVLQNDGSGNLSWVVPPSAPVTSVAGRTGAVTLSNTDISGLGTSATLNVSTTGNAAAGEVVKGDDTRLTDGRAPTGTAGGDLSDAYPNPTVARIQGRAVNAAAPAGAGQALQWDGTEWRPNYIRAEDLRTAWGGTQMIPTASCSSNQAMVWNVITDRFTCQNIANLDAAAIASGQIAPAQLGTGTADITTFLRGDGTWASVTATSPTTVSLDNGSASSPSLNFINSTATGIFTPAANSIGIATNGAQRMEIDSLGRVGIGNPPDAFSKLFINSTKTGSDSFSNGLNLQASYNGSISGSIVTGQTLDIVSNTNGSSNHYANGILANVTTSGIGSIQSTKGIRSSVDNYNSALTAEARVLDSSLVNGGSGTINNAYGFSVNISNTSSGFINNAYGVYISSLAGTNRWSMYSADPSIPSYLAGNLGIGAGTQVPTSAIDINGAITVRPSATPMQAPAGQGRIYFDSATNRFRVSENGGAYVDLVSAGGGGGTVTNVSSNNNYISVIDSATSPVITANVGTTANTLAAGDDSRITGSLQSTDYYTHLSAAVCLSTEVLYWDTITDSWECQNITESDPTVQAWAKAAPSNVFTTTGNIIGVSTRVPSSLNSPSTLENNQSLRWDNGTSQWNWYTPATSENSFFLGGNTFGTPAYIGTNDNQPLIFETNGLERMRVNNSNGRIGINTPDPWHLLDMRSNGISTFSNIGHGLSSYGEIKLGNTGGNFTTQSATQDSAILGMLGAVGHNGTSLINNPSSTVVFSATENWSPLANGSKIDFRTSNNSTISPLIRMTVNHDGKVGIGTTAPSAHLDVSTIDQNTLALTRLTAANNQYANIYFGAGSTAFDIRAFNNSLQDTASLRIHNAGDTGTPLFNITRAGRVGINQSSPTSTLHIYSPTDIPLVNSFTSARQASSNYPSANTITLSNVYSFRISNTQTVAPGPDNEETAIFEVYNQLMEAQPIANQYSGLRISYDNQRTTTLRNRVSINTTRDTVIPDFTLFINGTASNLGSTWSTSDIRYKENVRPLNSSLEKISKLEGVYYNWNHSVDPTLNFSHRTELGVIAQEVEKVFPEAVNSPADGGMKTVAYTMLIAPLIEAVKELYALINSNHSEVQAQNQELKSQIEMQNQQIIEMRAALCELGKTQFCAADSK